MNTGWKSLSLGEMSTIMYGHTAKSASDKGGPKYLRITDIQESRVNWDAVPQCDDNEIDLQRYYLADGDIVFARTGATTGKSFLIEDAPLSVFASYLIRVKSNKKLIESAFLYKYFQCHDYWENIKIGTSGSAQGGFNAKKLAALQIPIPPLSEQEEIVEVLDKAFAAIDQAKANIEQNIANAKELFQSKLNQIFSQKGEGWVETTLGEIGKISMCKRILKKQTTPSGDIPFYKIGTFGKTANAFIDRDIYENFKEKYSFPKKGDILISASGTIGRRVVFDGTPSYFQDSNIVWIDNGESHVLNEYLYQFYGVCEWNPSKGATISRLYNDDLRRIKISFPCISKQRLLVETMRELNLQSQSLLNHYQTKLASLDELKKSILQKAFAGELT